MNIKKLSIYIILFFLGSNIFSQQSEFPKIMYVNATAGLRIRNEPSTNSKVIGSLLYGARVVVTEKSLKPVVIGGITAYWYKTHNNDGWVFGGYLSETLPDDVPVFLSLWEEDGANNHIYYFDPNNIYREGIKESEWFANGKWKFNGDTLTLITEYGAYEKYDKPEIKEIIISIINKNTIILKYPDGNQVRLIRSNDCTVYL